MVVTLIKYFPEATSPMFPNVDVLKLLLVTLGCLATALGSAF